MQDFSSELEQLQARLEAVGEESCAVRAQRDLPLVERTSKLNILISELTDLHRLWADAWSVKLALRQEQLGIGLKVYRPRR